MSYNVVLTPSFKHSVKKLQKRFRHVKDDVGVAVRGLLQTPRLGVVIPGGAGVRKLRVRNTDLSKGKRGGRKSRRNSQRQILDCMNRTPFKLGAF